jgi:lipoprotein-anchoring transpeptidase ErfK/SrfK
MHGLRDSACAPRPRIARCSKRRGLAAGWRKLNPRLAFATRPHGRRLAPPPTIRPTVKLRTLAAAAVVTATIAPSARAQTPAAAPAVPQGPASALRLDLNIPENRLRVYDGDSLLKVYRVSVGLPGHDTPDGAFTIDHAEWNPWWHPPAREWAKNDRITPPGPNNPMGRVKLFFAPYYYIHGSPHVRDLGRAASHGCVRMMNNDVIELARLIHARNGGSLGDAEITRVLARPGQTRASRIATPVPLALRYDPVVVADGELRIYKDVYNRSRVHTEAVIQALIAAGYDPASVDRSEVGRVLSRAAAARSTYTVVLDTAFTSLRAAEVEAVGAR